MVSDAIAILVRMAVLLFIIELKKPRTMKYLFIFLPFFAMAQDSTLYGEIKPVGTTIDTCWQIKNGYMSLKPGCVFNSPGFLVDSVKYRGISSFQELYLEDRSFELIDSFRFNGAYYELRNNGWYKEITPDTIPRIEYFDYEEGAIKFKSDSVFRWVEEWTPCDQHFGEADHPSRDKIEQLEVKLLVWTGCTLAEWKATKIIRYNEIQVAANTVGLAVYRTETIRADVVVEYKAGGKWIKNSHIIKEL